MRFEFDWDPNKARSNLTKNGVSFEAAMAIFDDARSLTISDDDHSRDEERWVTIGEAIGPLLLVVVHTHVEIGDDEVTIRIISARRPPVGRPINIAEDRPHERRVRLFGGGTWQVLPPGRDADPPVHLDDDNLHYLSERAAAQGTSLSVLVNRLLRSDIELIEAVK